MGLRCLVVCLAGLIWTARLAGADEKPALRIETGMHTLPIAAIGTDPAGRLVVTASQDWTLRIWDVKSGALLRTLRLPNSANPPLKPHLFQSQVALSAEGRKIFFRARSGIVREMDRDSGKLIDAGEPWVASRAGGGWAATGYTTSGGGGLGIVDRDRAGRLVVASANNSDDLSLWDGKSKKREGNMLLKPAASVKLPGMPGSARFSPDGSKVVISYPGNGRIEVRSGKDLKLLYQPDTSAAEKDQLRLVTFSADGASLYAAGSLRTQGRYVIRRWEQAGQGRYQDVPVADQPITDLAPLPQGGIAFAASAAGWGVLSAKDDRVRWQPAYVADHRDGVLRVDQGGDRVQFGYESGGISPARFTVSTQTLLVDPPADPAIQGPRTLHPAVAVLDWKDSATMTLNGYAVGMGSDERCHSLAIAPDGRQLLLGGSEYIYPIDPGKVEEFKKTHPNGIFPGSMTVGRIIWVPAPALGVNYSGDGKLIVAALADGTLRWYGASDSRPLLLTLFPHADRKRWVAFTPSGYYIASPGGEDLIGWEVERGGDRTPDFFSVSRFRKRYYRPDIVSRVLRLGEEWKAVAEADYEAGKQTQPVALTQLLPPVMTILSPADGALVDGDKVTLRVAVRSPSGAPVTAVRARVNGRPVAAPAAPPTGDETGWDLVVPLPPDGGTVDVQAESAGRFGDPAAVRLLRRAPAGADPAFTFQPRLYVLSIGVGAYPSADLTLRYPAKDAGDLAAVLQAQAGKLYRSVEARVLADKQATRAAILDGLEWLQKQTTDKDVAVLFLAGHGVEDPGSGQYYFLPYDGDLGRMTSTLIPDVLVREALSNLAGKVLLFLDTCHAGKVFTDRNLRGAGGPTRFINELSGADNGVVVFASSTGRQSSQEADEWSNGAFTKAVVEGLRGLADYRKTGRITLNMLDLYVSERVKALTKGTQTPTTAKPSTVPDFPVAVVVR